MHVENYIFGKNLSFVLTLSRSHLTCELLIFITNQVKRHKLLQSRDERIKKKHSPDCDHAAACHDVYKILGDKKRKLSSKNIRTLV